MNFNDLILLLDSRVENLKQLSSMEIPFKVDNFGNEFFKTKDGYRVDYYVGGGKAWFNAKGNYHRLDGPALQNASGDKYWFVNSKLHRIDGPAIEVATGEKYWYVNGQRHRTDGPAIEYPSGTKYWFINGKKMSEKQFDKWRAKNNPIKESRAENLKQLSSMEVPYKVDNDGTEHFKTKDGYRVEYFNGDMIWYGNNWSFHRTDGPAIERADGTKYWIVNGKYMSEKQFNKWRAKNNPIKESRAENLKQLALMEIPYKVDNDGTEVYKTKDGYRVEDIDGFKVWYNAKGKLHRLDGPAIEQPNGTKAWYVNGERHRLDGPAIEHAGGHKEWFVNDAQLSKEQFNRRAKNNLSR